MLGEDVFEGVQIYDVIQDNAMNYWIATDNGVYKYDSYTFSKAECDGVQALSVFGFVKNQTGTIYCYNLNNQVLQIRDGVYSLFYELKPEERSPDIYLSITAQNELLVLTKTALLFSENGKPVPAAPIRRNYYGFPFLTAGGQTISHIANSDSLLLCEKGKFKTVKLRTGDGGPLSGVLNFFTLSGETYAISTAGKTIYAFNSVDYSLTPRAITELDNSKEVFRIYNENNQVWAAGVISGVRVLQGDGSFVLSGKYFAQYLISDVYRDMEGNLLLGTFNHGILVVPNAATNDVLEIPGDHSLVSIHTDDQLGLLMGTDNGRMLSYKDGTCSTLSGPGSRPLQSVFSWPGFPFVMFDNGNISALNKTTGAIVPLCPGSLKDAVQVDDSTFYLALNMGLSKVTWLGGDRFTCAPVGALQQRCYAVEFSVDDQLLYVASSGGVKTMDAAGNVSGVLLDGKPVFANDIESDGARTWLATKDGLVACSNGKAVTTVKTVIRGRPVELLKMDVHDGRVSGITTDGFAVFDMSGKVLLQLNRAHGFSTTRMFDFEIVAGETWVCHSGGVQKLSADMLNVPVAKPLIGISAVLVDDRPASLPGSGTYTSDERKFRFVLSSPTLRNSENIRYHYQLKGYDESWILADHAEHEVVYNALAPGDYTFSVKAENMGVFSETVSYSFTISAPFYLRWWFNVLVGLVLLLFITLVYKYRLQVQRRKAQLTNELHASRLTAIQSQMNPHFIFNALNSIQDLVLKGDVDNSYTFITKFSNLVRRTLNYSDKDFIDFEQEIALIGLYLSLEKLRFREDLDYTIDTAGIEDIMIPPMLIQPFIENALVHGLLHKEGKKRISIRFRLDEMLTCIIEDNGVGRAKAKEIRNRQRAGHESFSGQAIRKRFSILSQVFGDEFGHTYEDLYEDETPAGTRVTLTVPVKRKL